MLSFNILLAFFLSLVSFAGTSNLALPPTAPENTAVEVSEDFPCSWKLDPTYVDSLHTENITQMLGAKRQLFLENRNSDAYKRKKSTRFLPGFLRQTFMPNVSESAMECSADRQCSVGGQLVMLPELNADFSHNVVPRLREDGWYV